MGLVAGPSFLLSEFLIGHFQHGSIQLLVYYIKTSDSHESKKYSKYFIFTSKKCKFSLKKKQLTD